MIIDFHTHCFPDNLAAKAIMGLQGTSGLPCFSDGTLNGLKRSMLAAGINHSVLLPIAVKPQLTTVINDVAIENNKIDGFFSFGSVHPDFADFKTELRRIKNAGLKGIKLHPDFQGVDIDDERMVALINEAARLDMLVTVHAGIDLSFSDKNCRCTPLKINIILSEIRGAKLICAHSGGFFFLDDVEKYLVGKSEIYLDTSFSIGYKGMDVKQLERIYKNMDSGHVVFGTDSPWADQAQALMMFKSINLDDDLKLKILSDNARVLLEI